MTILAIDQGTTSTRALCVGADGRAQITHAVKHRQYYPKPGWVEHDAEELIANIKACIEASPGISAIGIDNQGESCLAWHADSKQALTAVIVWQDNRTHEVIEGLKRDGHEARVLELAGLPLDSYFSASKLAWILRNCSEAGDLLRQGKLRMGTTDAYFLDRLAGRFVTDISTASRTSLLNLESGEWDDELCELFGVPRQVLPEIVATKGDLGSIESQGRRIPVTASVVDQQASLYGHGCRDIGDAKITFGTGAFALMRRLLRRFRGRMGAQAGPVRGLYRNKSVFRVHRDRTRSGVCAGPVRTGLPALGPSRRRAVAGFVTGNRAQ